MPVNSTIAKTRGLIVIGGYAALLLAFGIMGVAPCAVGTAKARSASDKTQQEIHNNLLKQNQLVNVEKSIELINRQVSNYPRLVPENQELGDFLGSLSRELESVGMKDMDHKALATVTLGRLQKLTIELRGSGSFEQFHRFLKKLERMDRKCSIGRLVIESDPDLTGKVAIDLTLYIFNTKP
ncbi:MAG: type 4a pilus biogenesis protein PilO [Phycisphaerales bacterium]|nr:type 4a pilus biogenesis protein PilO [Phycisphaerales bacterium]